MSEHPKQPYRTLMACAESLVETLRPACHRVEIAGSLRRRQAFCSDIELVAIPKPILNLIGEPMEDTEVDFLLDDLPLTFSKRGRKQKQFCFDGTHAPFHVDLFLQPDPATWGMNFLLRTGSADFAHRFVTAKRFGGYKPDELEMRDSRVWRYGQQLDTPEEEDVFALWGMAWVAPEERG
jgi:DNA polymerase/3'-5' exonuclease PolX